MVLSASRSVSLASNLLARPVCCLGVKIGAELLLTALIPPSLCYSYLRRLNQSFAAGPGGTRHIFHPEQKRSRHSLSFWLCTGAQCSPALTSRIYWSVLNFFFSLSVSLFRAVSSFCECLTFSAPAKLNLEDWNDVWEQLVQCLLYVFRQDQFSTSFILQGSLFCPATSNDRDTETHQSAQNREEVQSISLRKSKKVIRKVE